MTLDIARISLLFYVHHFTCAMQSKENVKVVTVYEINQ